MKEDEKIIEKINDKIMNFISSDNPHNLTLRDLFYLCSLEDLKVYYNHSHIINDTETIKMLKSIIEWKLKNKECKEI